jgi:putative inorganic carbon (HCO3(-)) transporter
MAAPGWLERAQRSVSLSLDARAGTPTGAAGRQVTMRPQYSALFLAVACLVAASAGIGVARYGPIALIGLVSAVVMGICFVRPAAGMFLYVLMVYSRASDVIPDALHTPSFTFTLALFVVTAVVSRDGIQGLRRPRFGEWQGFVVYGLAMLASVFVAVNPALSVAYLVGYVKDLIAIGVLLLVVRRKEDLRLLVWGLLLAGVIPSILTIYATASGSTSTFLDLVQHQAAGIIPGQHVVVNRAGGPTGDPNYFALMLVPLAPLALYQIKHETSVYLRWLAVVALAVIAVALILTYSRGGYFAFAIVLLASAQARLIRFRTLGIMLIIAIIIAPFVSFDFVDRINTALRSVNINILPSHSGPVSQTDPSIANRTNEVRTGVLVFYHNPVLGVGIRNFPEHFQQYARPLGITTTELRPPHSLYVEIAAETGIIGLAAFGYFVAVLFKRLRRNWRTWSLADSDRRLAQAMAIALVGYLVGSLFLQASFPRFLWTLAASALAISAILNEAARAASTRSSVAGHVVGTTNRALGAPAIAHQRGQAPAYPDGRVDARTARPQVATLGALPRNALRPGRPPGHAQIVWSGLALVTLLALAVWGRSALLGPEGLLMAPSQQAHASGSIGGSGNASATSAASPTTPPSVTSTPAAHSGAVSAPVTATSGAPSPTPATNTTSALATAVRPADEQTGCAFDATTKHNVCGAFRGYWLGHGERAGIGAPLSEAFVESGRSVQYFEYAKLEQHLEFTGTAYAVLLARLGIAEVQHADLGFMLPVARAADPGCVYYDTTKHNVCGAFATYWISQGGLDMFGYPITEQFVEDGRTVQYFERSELVEDPSDPNAQAGIVRVPVGAHEIERELATPAQ